MISLLETFRVSGRGGGDKAYKEPGNSLVFLVSIPIFPPYAMFMYVHKYTHIHTRAHRVPPV